ncbi:MAG TPA: hypothetical protein VNL69_09960 [Bacteroidota bacterium]|nr:hypothetical protein [Bacteroidota bacterium]
MTKSKRVMRRLILSRLYEHLQREYDEMYPREMFESGEIALHDLDALLAFKSDPYLEELRHALDRLESGTYGVCLSCKGPISQDALDRDPTQRICTLCEEKFVAHYRDVPQAVAP